MRPRSRSRAPQAYRGALHERIPSRLRLTLSPPVRPTARPARRRPLPTRLTPPLPSLLRFPPPCAPTVAMAFVAAPLLTRGGGGRRLVAAPAATRPSMAAAPPSRGTALRSAAAAAVLALALGVGVPTAAHAVLPAPKLPPIDRTDKTRYVGQEVLGDGEAACVCGGRWVGGRGLIRGASQWLACGVASGDVELRRVWRGAWWAALLGDTTAASPQITGH